MATQSYMPRDTEKKNVDVTKLAQTQAPGHPPELQPKPGAENRTPAPTRAPADLSEIARSKSWGRDNGNPGAQAYGGPSSLNPSEKAPPANIDPHGPAGADPVLRNLAMGTARAVDQSDNWQTRRDVPSTGFKPALGMHAPKSDGTVPSKTGATNKPSPAAAIQAPGKTRG